MTSVHGTSFVGWDKVKFKLRSNLIKLQDLPIEPWIARNEFLDMFQVVRHSSSVQAVANSVKEKTKKQSTHTYYINNHIIRLISFWNTVNRTVRYTNLKIKHSVDGVTLFLWKLVGTGIYTVCEFKKNH